MIIIISIVMLATSREAGWSGFCWGATAAAAATTTTTTTSHTTSQGNEDLSDGGTSEWGGNETRSYLRGAAINSRLDCNQHALAFAQTSRIQQC